MKKLFFISKRSALLLLLSFSITCVFVIVCRLFDTEFANETIDWFSFFAGSFLVVEGVYKIRKFHTPLFPDQISRVIRILIGIDIVFIHLIQFFWGVNAAIISSPIKQELIDWMAFSFGAFLIIEGIYRIFTAKEPSPRDQAMRIVRILIGKAVLTIHILQFMR